MIAIEKPKAMITNSARIFLLETFLTALVNAPTMITLTYTLLLVPKKESDK